MGAVVLGPMATAVAPALAQEASASRDPLAIRIGANSEYTRVEFGGVIGQRSRIRREGQTVIVRIGATAAPDISRLRNDPPAGVTKVETRAVTGGTELVLTLAEGAEARSGVADGAVWLNLYAKAPAATSGAAIAPGSRIQVSAKAEADRVTLTFPWSAPVGAAVFRRGGAVWIVFDAAVRLDMPTAAKGASALGPAGEARWAAGPDYTVVRIPAADNLQVSAQGEGPTWTVTIGGTPTSAASAIEVARDDTAATALVARMAGATKAIWLTDPMVGDRFAAVTALAPGKGNGARLQTVDVTLLPTAQGLAVETFTDDLKIATAGDLVTVSRPRGLTMSAPSETLEKAPDAAAGLNKAPFPALILASWSDAGPDGFAARYRTLQDAASLETIRSTDDPRTPIAARMQYARFLVGSGLGFEAIGVLNAMIAKTPSLQGEPEIRGLRGAARASIGRFDEATADFSSGSLAGDPSTKVWQGYLDVQRGDWASARKSFAAGAAVIDQFPNAWKARFGAAHARAALETGDLQAARALLTYALSQNGPAAEQLAIRLVQARMFEMTGESDRALNVYKAIARAPLDSVAAPASLAVIKLSLAKGLIKPDDAAGQLEQLKWRWRGDETELDVTRTLGSLYLSQGRYREALETLRGAGKQMSDLPGSAEIQTDLGNAFRALFLDGAADGLQPVQAVALFYDFRELTPVGADGDEMVRRLSRRLIDVDLLPQAAELLKHQVDERLEGVAKAQVATNLATVYLMDRQPEKALQAIWSSRTTLLPTALNTERRALEARALMELGRYDHALETLGTDNNPEAQTVRAEIFWKQQNYAAAAKLYEARLGDRFKDTATPLSADEESRVIRAGIGYSLGRDNAALGRLSRNYAPFVERARSKGAMQIALDTLNGMDGISGATTFAGLTASADTFAGWVASAKEDFRKQTGGNG